MTEEQEIVLVRDAYGNELYFTDIAYDAKSWCKKNNITGENGEYIAL